VLAEALGRHHEAAVLLGAAARLRGAHDRTDRLVRDLTRRGRAALDQEAFAAAYGKGWDLAGKAAATEVDPARLSPEPGTADEVRAGRPESHVRQQPVFPVGQAAPVSRSTREGR
jgi:hypothetical protein